MKVVLYYSDMRKIILLLIFSTIIPFSRLYSYKVLFDWTRDETAGNADWVVDRDYPEPLPHNPQDERDWDGAFSSFGFAIYSTLHDTVYILHNAQITYHNNQNPMDLSNFDVFIIPEPQNPFTESEKDAIKRFVSDGGGLLMISDHNMSDRNRSGWDSPRVFNDLGSEQLFGIHFNITGESPNNFSEVSSNIPDRTHIIIDGPYGSVARLSFHAGDGLKLNTQYNPNVLGLIYKSGYSGNNGAMFAISTYGRGRVAALGDSSPIDDGTGDPHDRLYDGWNEEGTSHPALMLNAIYWLEKRDENTQEEPEFILDGILDSTATLFTQNGNTYIYTGKNDTVFYIGVRFNPDVQRTYVVLSFTDNGPQTSTPWGRDGYLPHYNFYFKIHNADSSVEIRDSFQLPAHPDFISYASSNGFIEFTLSKRNIPGDVICLLVAGYSTDGGGKIAYATPSIDISSAERSYSYLTINLPQNRKILNHAIKAVLTKKVNRSFSPQFFDLLGRRLPSHTTLLKNGIYFDRKNKKTIVILR